MSSNRLAFAALGIACLGAAAGGGYLAMRQNAVPTPAAAQGQQAATPAATTPAASRPVQETEGIVATTKPAAPVTKSAPAAKKADPSTRSASVRDTHAPIARQQQTPPPLTGTWPSSAASQPPAPVPTPAPVELPAPAPPVPQEPVRTPEPPQKTFEELVVTSGSVIGLQTETRLTSETARVEDRVDARVTRDELSKLEEKVHVAEPEAAIIRLKFKDKADKAKLDDRFTKKFLAELSMTQGPGDDEVTFKIRSEVESQIRERAVAQAKDTVSRRVDELGLREASVTTRDEDIIVEVPGSNEQSFRDIKETIRRTARLEFKMVDDAGSSAVFALKPDDLPDGEGIARTAGAAVFAGIEGTRPVLVEVQALVAPALLGTPRRAVVGWDATRLAMILAVLDTRCGLAIGTNDIYLNIAGGLRIVEPAADVA